MKFKAFALLCFPMCVMPVLAAPPKPSVETNPATIVEYRAVGVTVATTVGRASATDVGGERIFGYSAMDKMCADEFGPGARAATSAEAGRRSFAVSGSSPWVVPTGTVRAIASGSEWSAIDEANHSVGFSSLGAGGAITSAACFKFQSVSPQQGGPTIDGAVSNCETSLPILCSAPVAVPVYR
jgi:hypothetical protein